MNRVIVQAVMCASALFAVATGAGAQPPKTPPPAIELDLPLMEGDLKVSGRTNVESKTVVLHVYSGWSRITRQEIETQQRAGQPARPNEAAIAKARAENQPNLAQALECSGEDPVISSKPVKTDDTNGFEIVLKQRLNGGDCVVVEDDPLSRPVGQPRVMRSAIVRSAVLDLGRLRGYFSIGGTVSQGRSHFSQTDTFVGFTTDSRILGEIVVKEVCAETKEQFDRRTDKDRKERRCQKYEGPLIMRDKRWQLNVFADARVGFDLATTGSETTATTATGGQPAQAPFQRPDQLAFGWDQPGYFQTGIHAPFSVKSMDWRNDGRLYSFYVGPLYKWGVQAFDGAVVQSREVEIDTTKPETDTARYKTKSEVLKNGALPFYGYGVRMGIYRYELLGKELKNRQIANDPIGYFDVTVGKATAYRTYTFARTTNEANTIETVSITSDKKWRLMMEGRLKLPYVPALVGVDINIRGTASDDEPNDFRFVAAFRIDAQKALGRIFQSEALSQDRAR